MSKRSVTNDTCDIAASASTAESDGNIRIQCCDKPIEKDPSNKLSPAAPAKKQNLFLSAGYIIPQNPVNCSSDLSLAQLTSHKFMNYYPCTGAHRCPSPIKYTPLCAEAEDGDADSWTDTDSDLDDTELFDSNSDDETVFRMEKLRSPCKYPVERQVSIPNIELDKLIKHTEETIQQKKIILCQTENKYVAPINEDLQEEISIERENVSNDNEAELIESHSDKSYNEFEVLDSKTVQSAPIEIEQSIEVTENYGNTGSARPIGRPTTPIFYQDFYNYQPPEHIVKTASTHSVSQPEPPQVLVNNLPNPTPFDYWPSALYYQGLPRQDLPFPRHPMANILPFPWNQPPQPSSGPFNYPQPPFNNASSNNNMP